MIPPPGQQAQVLVQGGLGLAQITGGGQPVAQAPAGGAACQVLGGRGGGCGAARRGAVPGLRPRVARLIHPPPLGRVFPDNRRSLTLYPWDRRVVLGAGVAEAVDAECHSAIPG